MCNVLTVRYGTKAIVAGAEECEHVTKGTAKAFALFCEDDSFGPVHRYLACKACHDEEKAKDDASIVVCADCRGKKLKSQTRKWRWYDFYAAQGDIPTIICLDCWNKPAHQQRMAEDQEDRREEEMRLEGSEDEWINWDEGAMR